MHLSSSPSTVCTARRAPYTTARPASVASACACPGARSRAQSRARRVRLPRGAPTAGRSSRSTDAHEVAERVTHEAVEVDRQQPVGTGEVAEVHQEEGALLVAHVVPAGVLAHEPLEGPEVPLAGIRPDADRHDRLWLWLWLGRWGR